MSDYNPSRRRTPADCGPCATPDFTPGRIAVPTVGPVAPMEKNSVWGVPCDPGLGVYKHFYRGQGRVELTQRDPNDLVPPFVYTPIGNEFISIVGREIPGSMYGISVRVQTYSSFWSDQVEFALAVNGEIQGDPWLGNINWALPQPLMGDGPPTGFVQLMARFAAASSGGLDRPIYSLVIATGLLELYVESIDGNCE